MAYIFLVGPEAFHHFAEADVQYDQLSAATWGTVGENISYAYDDNGSQVYKIYSNVDNIETKTLAEVDAWLLAHATVAYEYHTYNLQNRLARTDKYSEYGTISESVEYRYDIGTAKFFAKAIYIGYY